MAEILAPLLIERVDPAEMAAAAAAKQGRPADDPYAHEPERHAALRLLSETPCSGQGYGLGVRGTGRETQPRPQS